jgi:predicted O-linked N-acetylglucosamine transferase (SPINDLY family)
VSDDEVFERVRADRIDVLVDAAGHFGDHRLTLFARRPAPVQVSGFGYCGTTGVRAIDYRLTDAWSDPPGDADRHHAERLWRLPHVCWCYRPFEPTPDVGPPPAAAAGHVTFGCLNNPVKMTDAVVAVWARVLAAVPGSRLLLLGSAGDPGPGRRFAARGVDPDRVEVAGRRPRAGYFELHNRIDVGLDPFPFNGDNTLCDAMWMGVPSVALAGAGFAARRGVSHLSAVGLADLVAATADEYVAVAARLAGDPPRLADLRRALRGGCRARRSATRPGTSATWRRPTGPCGGGGVPRRPSGATDSWRPGCPALRDP